jgi:hypothetical protein
VVAADWSGAGPHGFVVVEPLTVNPVTLTVKVEGFVPGPAFMRTQKGVATLPGAGDSTTGVERLDDGFRGGYGDGIEKTRHLEAEQLARERRDGRRQRRRLSAASWTAQLPLSRPATDAGQTARMDPRTPRLMWQLFEPVHAVTYFSEETVRAAADLGLRGFWAGYVVFRAAPMGTAAPAVVTASFHGFGPSRVAKVLPQAWDVVTPQQAIDARSTATGDALRRVFASQGIDDDHVGRAADALEQAAAAVDVAGRVLAAANAALPPREDPYERLWQATATLREHRGDGHVAALVAADVTPVESHLLKIAAGETEEERLRLGRAWDDEQWAAGRGRLHDRGWADPAGDLTVEGRAARDELERRTDVSASAPWRALGQQRTTEVAALLRPLAHAVADSGTVPFPNPVGLGWPPADA